jgi:hypothetical protein
MKIPKGIWIFLAGVAVGGVICFYSFFFLDFLLTSAKSSPPTIAGMKVPSKTYEIDFSKRYNLTLDSQHGSVAYTNCLIKGFTQGKEESSSRGYYFDTWLAVELPDGRMAYFSPRDIIMIEEAKP